MKPWISIALPLRCASTKSKFYELMIFYPKFVNIYQEPCLKQVLEDSKKRVLSHTKEGIYQFCDSCFAVTTQLLCVFITIFQEINSKSNKISIWNTCKTTGSVVRRPCNLIVAGSMLEDNLSNAVLPVDLGLCSRKRPPCRKTDNLWTGSELSHGTWTHAGTNW